jgi:hypothetical protein
VDEQYEFTATSYDALAAAGVAWWEAIHVLRHAHPVARRHIGAVLYVAGRLADGHLLVVRLIERVDDVYEVVHVHWSDADEAAAIDTMMRGGRDV